MASIPPRVNKDGTVAHRVMFRIDGRQAQESFTGPTETERFRALIDRIGGRAACPPAPTWAWSEAITSWRYWSAPAACGLSLTM